MTSQPHSQGAFASAVNWMARMCSYLAGVVLTAMALMSAWSIVGRAATGKPIQGDFELVQIGCAMCVGLFLPICQLKGGNIIVDFFTARASARTRSWLDAAGALVIAAMMALLTWRTAIGTIDVRANAETSMIMGVPIWWGYAGMLPGMAVTVLAALVTAQEALAPREGEAA
jgi:TRAP-type C4-dicarboxylate transport system permease small subunit